MTHGAGLRDQREAMRGKRFYPDSHTEKNVAVASTNDRAFTALLVGGTHVYRPLCVDVQLIKFHYRLRCVVRHSGISILIIATNEA